MTLGETIDRALQLFRANFSPLFLLMLAFQVPMYVLTKAFEQVSQAKAPVFSRPGAFRGVLPDVDQVIWFIGSFAVYLLGVLVVYQLAVAVLTCGAARAFLGDRIEPGRALREGMARAPQLVGTFFLLLAWYGLLLTLSMLPGAGLVAWGLTPGHAGFVIVGGVVALVMMLVVGLYLLLRYSLVSEVVVIERLSFVGALRRSASLMAGRVGNTALDNCKLRASILYAVNFCISASLMLVMSIPVALVNAHYGVSPLDPERYDPAAVPLWAIVPWEVMRVGAQAAVGPFEVLTLIVFYFDLRIKREGFDLEFLASRLGGPR